MVIIGYGKLKAFFDEHADAKDALNNCYRIVLKENWSDYHAAKRTFNTVDSIGNDRFVFNIRGNNYRLVAMIFFDVRTVFYPFCRHT